jgi:DnaJ-class molecular chaperone
VSLSKIRKKILNRRRAAIKANSLGLNIVCPHCKGDGMKINNKTHEVAYCKPCGGTGKGPKPKSKPKLKSNPRTPCPTCGGCAMVVNTFTGEVDDCSDCRASGYVLPKG